MCSKKTRYRLELYDYINRASIEMSPYSCYEKRELRYIVGPDSTRYSKYIKASSNIKYNIHSPSSED